MKVTWAKRRGALHFRASVDTDDRPNADGGQRLVRRTWAVEVPPGFDLDATHPDVLALAALLVVHPFVGSGITFPVGVSSAFAGSTGYRSGPVDPALQPRAAGARPGLAFSGGVDSTAALALLPDTVVAVYMRRVLPPLLAPLERLRRAIGRGSKFRPDAALHAVAAISAERTALGLASDLEFVRRPVGFPVDLATAVPAIVSADVFGLGSIAWGTVLESAYRVGHPRFEEYTQRWHWSHWSRLLASVGLPMNQVTAGLSEVATTDIALRSPFGHLAASCARGQVGEPCLACWKCFRKSLVERAVTGVDPTDTELDHLFAGPDAVANLRKIPIKHENVLAFATSGYRGDHRLMTLLRLRTRGDRLPVDWMRRWYSPAADLLPESSREATARAIASYLDPMTPADEAQVRAWDLAGELETEAYRANAGRLDEALS